MTFQAGHPYLSNSPEAAEIAKDPMNAPAMSAANKLFPGGYTVTLGAVGDENSHAIGIRASVNGTDYKITWDPQKGDADIGFNKGDTAGAIYGTVRGNRYTSTPGGTIGEGPELAALTGRARQLMSNFANQANPSPALQIAP